MNSSSEQALLKHIETVETRKLLPKETNMVSTTKANYMDLELLHKAWELLEGNDEKNAR